jgi:hypothetical protein
LNEQGMHRQAEYRGYVEARKRVYTTRQVRQAIVGRQHGRGAECVDKGKEIQSKVAYLTSRACSRETAEAGKTSDTVYSQVVIYWHFEWNSSTQNRHSKSGVCAGSVTAGEEGGYNSE